MGTLKETSWAQTQWSSGQWVLAEMSRPMVLAATLQTAGTHLAILISTMYININKIECPASLAVGYLQLVAGVVLPVFHFEQLQLLQAQPELRVHMPFVEQLFLQLLAFLAQPLHLFSHFVIHRLQFSELDYLFLALQVHLLQPLVHLHKHLDSSILLLATYSFELLFEESVVFHNQQQLLSLYYALPA